MKPDTLEAHALNQSAAAVFDLCDGKTSKSEIAAEIQRRTGLPADEEIVELALAELVDAGLVVVDEPESPFTISRRSLVRRLSLSAAAVMMLPVVETILVPPAAAQVSPTTTSTSSSTSSTTSSTTSTSTSSTTTTTRTPSPTPTLALSDRRRESDLPEFARSFCC